MKLSVYRSFYCKSERVPFWPVRWWRCRFKGLGPTDPHLYTYNLQLLGFWFLLAREVKR